MKSEPAIPHVRSSLLVAGVAFLSISVATMGQSPRARDDSSRTVSVSAMRLERMSKYELQRKFTGQAEARRRSLLGFERIGRIAEITVDVGDDVTKGQLLATLDCDSLNVQSRKLESELKSIQAKWKEAMAGPRPETIAAAQAVLEEQKSQYKLAVDSLARRQRLHAKRLIAQEELDQATANSDRWKALVDAASSRLKELNEGTRQEQIDALAANVEAIRAALEQIDVEIQKSALRSPYDGKVLGRTIDEGSVTAPGQSVVSIIEHKVLEAKIGVPHAFVKGISKGDSMMLECNDESIQGTVTGIVSELDIATRTQSVIFRLGEEAWEKIVPGDTVSAVFTQEKTTSGFWVPTECLTSGPRGLWNCFVVEDLNSSGVGTASIRTVEVIHSAGDRSLIIGAVEDGEILVSTAPHRIIAGQKITPQWKPIQP